MLLPRRCNLLLGGCQLTLDPGQICADARLLLFGPLQAVAHLAQPCFRLGPRAVGGRDALFALRAHRHQFLVRLPCLGRGLLDRLGQLGRMRLGRLLRRFQLAPFGLHRSRARHAALGSPSAARRVPAAAAWSRPNASAALDSSSRRSSAAVSASCSSVNESGLPSPADGARGVAPGCWASPWGPGDCWIRVGPGSCAPGAGIGIAASSTVLPIPTNVANAGPNQVLANRWARNSVTVHSSLPDAWYRSARAAPMDMSLNLSPIPSS